MSLILLPDNLTSQYIARNVNNFRIVGKDTPSTPSGVDFSAVAKYLNRMSIIKPFSEDKIHVKLVISESEDFSDPIAEIMTTDPVVRPYFKIFEAANDEDVCGWVDFSDAEGLGPQYNEKPIYFNIVDFLTEKCGLEFKPTTVLYVKYFWFSYDGEEGREVVSDWYSMVFPQMTEVGANSSEVVLKRDFQKLIADLEQTVHISYKDDDLYWVMEPGLNKVPEVLPIEDDGDTMFLLKDYTDAKRFDIKFTIGPKPEGETASQCLVSFSKTGVGGSVIKLNDDYGEFCEYPFDWDKSYYITVSMGTIIVNQSGTAADIMGELDTLATRLDTLENWVEGNPSGISQEVIDKATQLYDDIVVNYTENYPRGLTIEDMRDRFGQFLSTLVHRS